MTTGQVLLILRLTVELQKAQGACHLYLFQHSYDLAASLKCVMLWLCGALLSPLMLFTWAIDTKNDDQQVYKLLLQLGKDWFYLQLQSFFYVSTYFLILQDFIELLDLFELIKSYEFSSYQSFKNQVKQILQDCSYFDLLNLFPLRIKSSTYLQKFPCQCFLLLECRLARLKSSKSNNQLD